MWLITSNNSTVKELVESDQDLIDFLNANKSFTWQIQRIEIRKPKAAPDVAANVILTDDRPTSFKMPEPLGRSGETE